MAAQVVTAAAAANPRPLSGPTLPYSTPATAAYVRNYYCRSQEMLMRCCHKKRKSNASKSSKNLIIIDVSSEVEANPSFSKVVRFGYDLFVSFFAKPSSQKSG